MNRKNNDLFKSEFSNLITSQENDAMANIIHLEGINFSDNFILKDQIFRKKVLISNSVFYSDVSMTRVTFEKGVNFKHCDFKQTVNLTRVKFLKFAEFGECIFHNLTVFQNITFNGTSFHNAVFKKRGEFNRCSFSNYTSFRNIKTPNKSSLISFYYNGFTNNRNTEFEYNDMSKVSFIRSDLTYVKFDDVKWHKPKWPSAKRNCLINEFVNYSNGKSLQENLGMVKEQYQSLKMNFEENRNFAMAGDFHYGEMECQRKAAGFFRFLPTLTTIYWASSGYGEKINRAVSTLCILLAIWVISHMFLGLRPNSLNAYYEAINYEFKFDLTKTNAFAKDSIKTLIYVLEVLLREEKPNRVFSPVTNPDSWLNGDLINSIGFILVYLQAVFLGLAVKRKFRR
ncbi:MAG: pentapeptide repeat-containing protein [Deferribacteres bacterium]|nr:pentapeptide repeat-containing protein [Deferribacteres bacterium]